MHFNELGLSPKVLAAVEAAGYEQPTPIQEQAIPVALEGRDVLGIAQTGTGKTASFVLPMLTLLERGRARARMPRSLIIAPTRELAAQVAASFEQYGAEHKLTVALLIGGVSFDEQFRKLDRGADVLIATPGRLLDHFGRGKILLNGVEILVIDEADRMLDMGFIPDIERICKLLPAKRQTLFFSATMPNEIQRLVKNFLKDPVRVEVSPQSMAAGTITQRFHFCSADPYEKRAALREVIADIDDVKNAIIFCNRKRDVGILLKSLEKHGFNVGALHGDMDQRSRMDTLEAFRNGEITFLAASDVAARGLDIPDVSHVFNYDMPMQAEDYVHRIGRTGRAGRKGFAAALVTPDDAKVLKEIEAFSENPIEWIGEPPSEEDLKAGKRRRRGDSRSTARSGTGTRGGRKPARGKSASGEGDKAGAKTERDADEQTQATPRDEQPAAAEAKDESTEHKPKTKVRRKPAEPAQDKPKPARGKGGRQTAREDKDDTKDTRQAKDSKPSKSGQDEQPRRGGRRHKDSDKEQVVGLGDHVPEFLKRPVTIDR